MYVYQLLNKKAITSPYRQELGGILFRALLNIPYTGSISPLTVISSYTGAGTTISLKRDGRRVDRPLLHRQISGEALTTTRSIRIPQFFFQVIGSILKRSYLKA